MMLLLSLTSAWLMTRPVPAFWVKSFPTQSKFPANKEIIVRRYNQLGKFPIYEIQNRFKLKKKKTINTQENKRGRIVLTAPEKKIARSPTYGGLIFAYYFGIFFSFAQVETQNKESAVLFL